MWTQAACSGQGARAAEGNDLSLVNLCLYKGVFCDAGKINIVIPQNLTDLAVPVELPSSGQDARVKTVFPVHSVTPFFPVGKLFLSLSF